MLRFERIPLWSQSAVFSEPLSHVGSSCPTTKSMLRTKQAAGVCVSEILFAVAVLGQQFNNCWQGKLWCCHQPTARHNHRVRSLRLIQWVQWNPVSRLCRWGFHIAVLQTLRLVEDGVLHLGPPCGSFVWINSATSGRSRDLPWGDESLDYVKEASLHLVSNPLQHFSIFPRTKDLYACAAFDNLGHCEGSLRAVGAAAKQPDEVSAGLQEDSKIDPERVGVLVGDLFARHSAHWSIVWYHTSVWIERTYSTG